MENLRRQLEHTQQMLRDQLNEHDIEYLMDMLREEFPFKPEIWYDSFETKEEIIDRLVKGNEYLM
jgi:hypothetical protein